MQARSALGGIVMAAMLLPSTLLAAAADPVRATQLIGQPVRDLSGSQIAVLEDLVLDPATGESAVAVLQVGADRVAYRLPSAKARIDQGGFRLDEDAAALARLPKLRPGEAPGDPSQRTARALLRANVLDRKGADIGDLDDLLLQGTRVTHAVVAFDRTWYPDGGLVGLPLASLAPRGADFVADFDRANMRPAGESAPGAKAEATAAAAPAMPRDVRITQLIGRPVMDASGRRIARVAELVVDTREERVSHAVLAIEGSAPERRVALALPANEGRFEGGAFRTSATPESLAALPAFAPPQLGEWNRRAGADRYFRASTLLTTGLVDETGTERGDLREIVVDLASGKVHYAVAEFDPEWVKPGTLVAIRFGRIEAGETQPRMAVSLGALYGAMTLAKGAWPDLDNPAYRAQIDKYLGAR